MWYLTNSGLPFQRVHVPRKKFLWRKYAQCCNIAHRPLALRPWVEDPWPCVRGKKLDFLQKLDVSDFVGQTHLIDLFGPKPSLTRGSEWPFKYLDGAIRLTTLVTSLTRCRFGSRSEIQLASCSGQAKTLLRWNICIIPCCLLRVLPEGVALVTWASPGRCAGINIHGGREQLLIWLNLQSLSFYSSPES